jgi:hypothetical protein
MTSMASPLGALSVGPVAFITKVEDDVDGRPPGGRCRRVRQRPPSSLKTTLMVGPWEALPTCPVASATEFEDDVDGEPPGGAASGSGGVHHRG